MSITVSKIMKQKGNCPDGAVNKDYGTEQMDTNDLKLG
jgi:hypothetical protein